MCVFKEDLGLNNLQWLMCHKTQSNQNQSCANDFHTSFESFENVVCLLHHVLIIFIYSFFFFLFIHFFFIIHFDLLLSTSTSLPDYGLINI